MGPGFRASGCTCPRRVSVTALGAAKMRAHLLLDGEPKVFRENPSLLFSGRGEDDEGAAPWEVPLPNKKSVKEVT